MAEALQLRREVLGPRHPATLTSMNNLALLYQSQGRYGAAELLLADALQRRREVLGPRHPDTLGSMNNLAGLYQSEGALRRRRTALTRRRTAGPPALMSGAPVG